MAKGKNQSRGRRGGARQGNNGRMGPAQLRTNIEFSHQFRFTSTSAALTAITAGKLLSAAGVVATTAVLGHAVNQSVKVNRVEIWAPPASQGAFATCSVLFPSTQMSQAREITDTSVSVSQPAHINATPPERSLCAFWSDGTNIAGAADTLFSLVAPPGSIIDVWVSLILNDGTASGDAFSQATLVGATVGSLYYTSLDSQTSAGSIYKPVGLTTL